MRALSRPFYLLFILSLIAWGCDCDSSSGNGDGDRLDAADGDGGENGGDAGDAGDAGDGGGGRPDSSVQLPTEVHVVISIDNGYGFGYGSAQKINHYFEGQADHGAEGIFHCSYACEVDADCLAACEADEAQTDCPTDLACDAFGSCNNDRRGPETYIVPAEAARTNDYLYVIAWSDESGTQGFIGQFKDDRGWNRIYTGDGAWEVCATGDNYDPPPSGEHQDDTGPPLEDGPIDGAERLGINEWIRRCNLGADAPAGERSYSEGWVTLTEANSRGHRLHALEHAAEEDIDNFPDLCGRHEADADRGDAIDPAARWLWYYDPAPGPKEPGGVIPDPIADPDEIFTSEAYLGDFYIFRLPTRVVIAPPG